ncbi:hypothetical protein CMV14_12500 [Rhizorhabdus dicambivorans]|nr:hypothetical protein CMV14_12500 [Rhizorhabdus dicambivorans]
MPLRQKRESAFVTVARKLAATAASARARAVLSRYRIARFDLAIVGRSTRGGTDRVAVHRFGEGGVPHLLLAAVGSGLVSAHVAAGQYQSRGDQGRGGRARTHILISILS